MEISVVGRHLDITDPIQLYAEEKAGRLARFFDRVQKVDLVAEKQDNHSFEVEIIAHVARHEHFVAKAKGDDLYGCIDQTVSKIERQIHDHKEKLQEHHR